MTTEPGIALGVVSSVVEALAPPVLGLPLSVRALSGEHVLAGLLARPLELIGPVLVDRPEADLDELGDVGLALARTRCARIARCAS
jgi:hypothetical protein